MNFLVAAFSQQSWSTAGYRLDALSPCTDALTSTSTLSYEQNGLDEHFSGTLKLVVLGSIAAFLLILVIIVGIYSCSVGCKKKEAEMRVEENPVYEMSNYEDNTYIKDSNTYYKP